MTSDVQIPLEPVGFRFSFSQWESYNSCPQRWKFKSKMRLPGLPPGPAAARGLEIHDSIERYVLGGGASVLHPAVNHKYIPIFDELKNHENGDRWCEKKLGFDKDWHVSPPTAKTTQCIAILDAVRFTNDHVAKVYEWKSGKPKDTHPDQRKLYAPAAFIHWKAVSVEVTTFYVEDTAPPQKVTVSASGVEKLKTLWDSRIKQMQTDEFCAPRPAVHCNWCDYAKKRGGPCQFGA